MSDVCPSDLADAQRNRQLIIDAARDFFTESGADAPLDEIARRAGVGIATLYRRFPDRDDLIRAVVLDTFAVMAAAVAAAEAEATDSYDALCRFMHAALDAKIGATMPALAGRVVFDDEVDAARLKVGEPVQALLERAQADGLVRPEVAFGDITFMVMRLTRPLPAVTKILVDDSLAHRHLDIYLDGLRAAGDTKRNDLPEPAVSLRDFELIRAKLSHQAEGTEEPG
jgi:AcrR family transcriptional regulator